jgi:hypothetical protein
MGTEQDAHQADRRIDEEDESPKVLIDEPTTQDRPDGRRYNGGNAKGAQSHSLLGNRKRAQQQSYAQRQGYTAAKPLDPTRDDEEWQVGR